MAGVSDTLSPFSEKFIRFSSAQFKTMVTPSKLEPMNSRYRLFLLFLLALAFYTRFVGLTRGESDFVSSEERALGLSTSFHAFHPDEQTLARAALELRNPLDPPLTAYGMLPLYIWRGALELANLCTDAQLDHFDSVEPQIYLVVRLLSVLISFGSILLVWYLGREHYCAWTAALGALFFTLAPVATQLAHFATVDGLHTLLCLGAFALILRAQTRPGWQSHFLAGLAIGAAGAVRLNGLLLGPVLVVGYLLRGGGLRALATSPPWIAGATALLTLLFFQPYMVLDPDLLFRAENSDDFGFSLQVARGEFLRIWTLVDVHTPRYLYYWTHLLPLACGWPLTLGIAIGIVHAIWQRKSGLVLLFCGLYFAQVGGLHTKHVRYLLPLLPFLVLLAADFCVKLVGSRRRLGLAFCGTLVLYTGFYGLAFARIYSEEDSRIQAARAIAGQVPPGRTIGLERGGFSMNALVGGPRNPTRQLNTSVLFEARGYSTCRSDINYLGKRLQDLDYITLVDVNRYRQFIAVPERIPSAAAFYRRLVAGELGYRVIGRFKVYPSLFGLAFHNDDAEPSFLGYDHPAVYFLERTSTAAVADALESLDRDLERDPNCPDSGLRAAATALKAEDLDRAEDYLNELEREYPHAAIVPALQAEIYRRTERTDKEQEARNRHQSIGRNRAGHVLYWAMAVGFLDLGLENLAATALTEGTLKSPQFPPWASREMALAYVLFANEAYDSDHKDLAWTAYQQSSQISPNPAAFNRLAFMAFRRNDPRLAVEFWLRSVRLRDDQAGIHSNLGQVYAQHLDEQLKALHHLDRAIRLDPNQREELMPWVEMARKKVTRESEDRQNESAAGN